MGRSDGFFIHTGHYAGSSRHFVPVLPKIKCPVLIIGGKVDFVTAAVHSEEMHKAMPQSELHIVERASHSVFTDRPDYVFTVIEEFVNRTFHLNT